MKTFGLTKMHLFKIILLSVFVLAPSLALDMLRLWIFL